MTRKRGIELQGILDNVAAEDIYQVISDIHDIPMETAVIASKQVTVTSCQTPFQIWTLSLTG